MKDKNINSFGNALRGIWYCMRNERNFQIHLVIASAVIVLMLILNLNKLESSIIIILIFFVIVLEMINTSLEKLLDIIEPQMHPMIRVIKDIVAGSVLVSAGCAVVVGLIIFIPYIL